MKKVPKNYIDKIKLIKKILSNYITKKNKKLLFDTLKEIQKEKETSIEFIKYLFLEAYQKKDIKKINKNRVIEVNKIIDKFDKLLRNSGIKIDLRPVTYLQWKRQIDLFKTPRQRFLRFFKL